MRNSYSPTQRQVGQVQSGMQARSPGAPAAQATLPRIRRRTRARSNLLLDLPIGGRLILGFLIAALLAALVTGIIGLQRAQTLDRQAAFYQNLLQANTKLNTAANYLQLMNSTVHVTLDAAAQPHPSQETLKTNKQALQNLATLYDHILNDYLTHDLLSKHDEQVALLDQAGHPNQASRQTTLAASTLRTWRVYRTAQEQVLNYISSGEVAAAQHLEQVQGEPTQADALSALRSLIQFNGRLASYVQDAARVEEQSQLYMTIIGSVLTFFAIGLVGWFFSGTIIRRLQQLRRVTQAVENGQLTARVTVIGRDEIAEVSESVNAMLEAIARLFEETSRQRDALTNAAEHLFSNMRIVSAGDLRVSAPVSSDPIGMLANAFNFTVGRFRRFVMRTQTDTERLNVLARQAFKRSEAIQQTLNRLSKAVATLPDTGPVTGRQGQSEPLRLSPQPEPAREKEMLLETIRLTGEFASEINTLARKLSALAQEIHLGTVSFQFEESSSDLSSTPTPSQPWQQPLHKTPVPPASSESLPPAPPSPAASAAASPRKRVSKRLTRIELENR
ncbi:MAG: methyl-accepting chemotaxis protein [Ktedonobacteraceae bacterium]|nr:methyl-accepting chemotaxis protein [Ktedonobacteraceae bacterium]